MLIPESTVAASRMGMWRLLDVCYSWIPEASRPKEIIRAIHVFDQDFVPLWVKRVYETPAGTQVVVGYHCIARHMRKLRRSMLVEGELGVDGMGMAIFYRPADWPSRWTGGVKPIRTLEGAPRGKDVPFGAFVPFDWRVFLDCQRDFYDLRQARKEVRRKRKHDISAGVIERQKKAEQQHSDDGLYRLTEENRHDMPHVYVP